LQEFILKGLKYPQIKGQLIICPPVIYECSEVKPCFGECRKVIKDVRR